MENKIWKAVLHYDGLYEVSSCGMVRSLPKTRTFGNRERFIEGRILKSPLNSTGRPTVVLYKDGNKISYGVHKLVAGAFLGPKIKGQIVRHLNGNPVDNRATNLAYGTHKQNTNDRIAHGTMHYGESAHNSKLTKEQVEKIRSEHKFRCSINGTMAQARRYNVSPTTISAVIHKQNWKWFDVPTERE